MADKTVRFGIIGLGLMGREFASAVMRWNHLKDFKYKPEIIAVCDINLNDEVEQWYRSGLGTVKQAVKDYTELLANPEVEAVYCAVPHNLHMQIYSDIIRAGKHLMGEKPFGIDRNANEAILSEITAAKDVFVRCSSEYPFAPAMQKIGSMIEGGEFGRIIEVEAGFLHSSDMDPLKPINWKRMVHLNGEYGVMGDLGLHPLHVPLRAGWMPTDIRAFLSNIIDVRPDGKGGTAPCETWDNAQICCSVPDEDGNIFPMTIKTQRIAPCERNTWYVTIKGLKKSASFSTKHINSLRIAEFEGKEQVWRDYEMGHATAYASVTGDIFEIGFSDLILQMWAAYVYELMEGKPKSRFAGCVTPEETFASHRIFTAALESHRNDAVVTV